MSPRKVWAVARKELRQASRDPLTLAMLLGLPTAMLLLYGYAINFDVRHVRLAVQDGDRTPASREVLSAFLNSTYFDLVRTLPAGADLEALTETREARAVLVIPEGFGAERLAGRTAYLQILVDGADANTATTVLNYANSIVNGLSGVPPAVDVQSRVLFNPELQSTQFLVPGLVGFILMLTAVLSTALSVVRERERGTMEQLRVTSLRPGELIVGKTLPYLAISLLATLVIFIVADLLFEVVVKGPYLDLFVVTFIYLVGALGFGLLVSTLADSQAMAFQVGMVASMLPAIFLSGFIFPIRSMPVAVQAITYAVPTRYFLVVLRGIVIKGAGLVSYLQDVGFLVLYAAVVLGIAYLRLTRKEA